MLSAELQLRARLGAEAGATREAQLAAAAFENEAVDRGLAAAQRQREFAVAHVHALQQVAHRQPAARQLAGDFRGAETAAERGPRAQHAAQAPARWRERGPGAEVGNLPLEHALHRGVGARPGGLHRQAQALCASQHAQVAAGQRLREVPGAVLCGQRQAQVRQAEGLGAGVVGQRQVAAGAL